MSDTFDRLPDQTKTPGSPQMITEQFFHSSAALLAVLACPARIRILDLVTEAEVSVGDLVETLGISQSATSQHLAKLRLAGLVRTRREAQMVYYSTKSTAVSKILKSLRGVFEDQPTTLMRAGPDAEKPDLG